MSGSSGSQYLSCEMEDGVLVCTYAKNLKIDLEVAKQVSDERLRILAGNTRPCLLFTHHLNFVNKEARDYFAVDGVKGMSALAIIPGNFIAVVATNLFITFSRPSVPTRAFKNKTLAFEWLNQFK
jgi:hypothetical protein